MTVMAFSDSKASQVLPPDIQARIWVDPAAEPLDLLDERYGVGILTHLQDCQKNQLLELTKGFPAHGAALRLISLAMLG